ncbi:PAS domain S-box protein [Oscillatoria acuminata]|uniref:Circadian input-output histidine kinase CikA n=1 Tax=Oscillatoria acuminata PCC 6304 TaxID=56110 RepID=K9TIY4_9CYAN|nr:PAS domain S-box protein [Oscillatoria acuminata]AFY82782.1 PAS domain S-box [Oscillatoria acuminata PCC 6304]
MIKISPSVLLRLLSKLSQLCYPKNQPSTPLLQFLHSVGIALVSVTLATVIKSALAPLILGESPFLVYFAAIMVSAWFGGPKAGVMATLGAGLVSSYLFLSPGYALIESSPSQIFRLILFLIEGSAIVIAIGSLQHTKQQFAQSARTAQQHFESFLQSEQRFHLLVDGIEDYGLYMLAPDGRVNSWNPGAERLKGYAPEEIIGQHFSCFYPPEAVAEGQPERDLKQAAEQGRLEQEAERLRKDRTRFWVHEVITPLFDKQGNLYGFSKISRDITESKQTEAELRASEQRFKTLAESTVEGILFYEGDCIIAVNRSLEKIFGYDPDDLNGLPLASIFTEETVALMVNDCQWMQEGASEAVGIKKEGTMVSLEAVIQPTLYLGRSVWMASVRDISDRKRAEADLQQTLKELSDFQWALDKSAIVATTDAKGTIQYVNEKFIEISKYSESELIGQDHRLINSGYHPKEFFINLWVTIGRGEVWRGEIKNRAKDGTYYWVDTVIVPFLDSHKKPFQYLAIRYDISQRKQAEEALRDSEKRFRDMADTAPVLLWIANCQGQWTFLNKWGLNFIGALIEADPDLNHRDRIHPEDQVQCVLSYQQAVRVGQPFTQEYRLQRSDGAYRWMLETGVPRWNPEGNLVGFIGSAIDITPLKQADTERMKLLQREQSARTQAEASEQYYRFLSEAIPQMVWTALPDGTLDYLSHRWSEYTGLSEAELLGWGWEPIVHPDDLAECNQRWAACLENGEPYEIEARMRRGCDGAYRWHLGLAVPMRDHQGAIVKWFGTNTDIHERKQVQQERMELLEREKAARILSERATTMVHRLQAIVDVAIAPLSLDDLVQELLDRLTVVLEVDAAVILLVNEDQTALIVTATKGLDLEQPLSPNIPIPMGLGFSGQIAQTRQPMRIDHDAYTQVISPLFRHKKIESIMGAPMLLEDRVLGVLHVSTESRREFMAEDVYLLQLVADRVALAIDRANLYEAQQQARDRAEKANRLKDEFLAIVSHELRTPLNSILGWAQLLRARTLKEETRDKALETIERNAKHQVTLIDDILDVSRIMRGKIRLTRVPLYLETLVEQAISTVTPAAEAKSIEIYTEFNSHGQPILGDTSRLHQIVWNLLSNAVKFTPNGGRLTVAIEQVGDYLEFRVQDTGIGITGDFLPHVFEGFRQANSSSTRTHGGLGLGLTIVRYLVELHGGTVHAFSQGEGTGSTFTVALPIGVSQNSPLDLDSMIGDEKAIANCALNLAGLQVLVVDDDRDTGELIAQVLAEYGVQTTVVLSAAEALAATERSRHDILISDIGMPEEDGYVLIRKIRQREAGYSRPIPAIALTAFAREEDRQQALLAGFHLHVAKPVEPLKLAKALADIAQQTGLI